jgi:hypothetical protein
MVMFIFLCMLGIHKWDEWIVFDDGYSERTCFLCGRHDMKWRR